MDGDPDLIAEGQSIIQELEQQGYNDIIHNLSHCAAQFLENLHTLTTPLKIVLPSLASLDVPLIRFYNEAGTGVLVAKCTSACVEWVSLLQGLIPSAFKIIDDTVADVKVKEYSENPSGYAIEFYIRPGLSGDDVCCPSDNLIEDIVTDGVPKISPATFCRILPFHMMLDEDLTIVQTGHSLARIIKGLVLQKDNFNDKFELITPAIQPDFETMKSWADMPVLIKYKLQKAQKESSQKGNSGKLNRCYSHPIKKKGSIKMGELLLRGQITYVAESNRLIFLGSPSVQNISELSMQGLFLSDIPLHDSTRDLLLFNEQLKAERDLAKKLENATLRLEETCVEMEAEKELSDNLVYSILPSSVAECLRSGQPVEAKKYRSITILFCGICDFDTFCTTLAPMQMVDLLNDIYTKFDALADPQQRHVYKMETVGDKYMLVSGLSEKNTQHATNITNAALDMLDIACSLEGSPVSIKVQIGVHTGEVVAGVVGQKLPHYAVFGGSVCLASRMESMAEPNKVNLSEMAYRSIVDSGSSGEFEFEDRGLLKIKGWSESVKCYFVLRKK